MNLLKKLYYRTYQGVFKIAIPFLPIQNYGNAIAYQLKINNTYNGMDIPCCFHNI